MYTYESGRRKTSPEDTAADFLADAVVGVCSPEDVAATLRVLDAMTDQSLTEHLADRMTLDQFGNPVMDTPETAFAQRTWSKATDLADRLRDLRAVLAHAAP